MFLPSNKQIPAVGVSIGIERIFTIIQERERQKKGGIQQTYTQVMVASVGGDLTLERMAICAELWKGGICAEMIQKRNPYFDKQLEYTLDMKIPFLVIIGQNEIDEGTVKVKNTASEVQEVVVRSELVETLRRSLANLPQPQ
uniref:Anticodon-binding domain-containing protein n=1 Tax=Spongospora subterranea TaxID=70186 RepID=A0A0H5QKZ9_9EUKA|eukprot:CRZ02693.1 hypothetical protein [Spongospora subterranea]